MKITKRQLRRIIKEEKTKLLNEGMPGVDRQVRDLWDSPDEDYSAPPGEEDYYSPGGEGDQATDAQLMGGWSLWLSERGLEFEDLDDLAQFAGAPNRTWLDVNPPHDGMIGPADIEVWAEDQKAAREILATRAGSYKGTTLPGGEKIGEGTLPKDMPDSWRQILGSCLGEDK
tara:strand:+ start:1136 stop:1651 length:516 start_codon:yes stop_codon:yes gene_type:complete